MKHRKSELFEHISDRYSRYILNWAYKKVGYTSEAEDLAQEVMLQIFVTVNRMEKIRKLENLIWKIAHNVFCRHLRARKTVIQICCPFDDLSPQDEENYLIQNNPDDENITESIRKMREGISRLDYLQREAMIMHYLENVPLQEVAKRLAVPLSTIKWHLFASRKKMKEEMSMEISTEYNYRPEKLTFSLSGSVSDYLNINVMNHSVVKQNICAVCRREAKTLDEIGSATGIPKAYLEEELKWLVDREFMEKKGRKYQNTFFVEDAEYQQACMELAEKCKGKVFDKIIKIYRDICDEVHKLNFHGSKRPMEKLLWMIHVLHFEYLFTRIFDERMGVDLCPLRKDGQFLVYATMKLSPDQLDAYTAFEVNGILIRADKKARLTWCGFYDFAYSRPVTNLFGFENERERSLFLKILGKTSAVDKLTKNEKSRLSEYLKRGWFSSKNGKIEPNFYLLTEKDESDLMAVFEKYHDSFISVYDLLYEELSKLHKKSFPKYLQKYFEVYMRLQQAKLAQKMIVSRMQDGTFYKPKSCEEGEILTLCCVLRQ